jgi:serine/threonine-protein kinase HipA
MARTLDVYLRRDLTGKLTQDEHGEMTFAYAQAWLDNPAAIALSRSLPLRTELFSRKECRGFFAGILPEESKRELVARNLGISAQNDFAMLEQIGGECAGAVTFMPAGTPLPQAEDRYRALSESELAAVLKELPRRPLLAGDKDIRLSLAGAQDKIAVHVAEGKFSLPLGGSPSSHILKPANPHLPGLVFNEAFCMRLAGAVGLPVAKVATGKAGETEYLLVERYDRKDGMRMMSGAAWPHTERLHQEDFCQSLGIPPELKYQNEGGPSLKQCFELVRDASDAPVIDLQHLLDAVIFNFLIGNHDAHGKNFSLLYSGETILGRATHLAPFYDILSTVFYPDLTKKMAMNLAGEYESAKIAPRHFERFADEAGLAKPIVKKRVTELAQAIMSGLDKAKTAHQSIVTLPKLIHDSCQQTLDEFRRAN